MDYKRSLGERLFDCLNLVFLGAVGLLALYPFIFVVGLSFTSGAELAEGRVYLFPKQLTLTAYELVFNDPQIRTGYLNSIVRTVGGTVATLLMTSLAAYPLSRRQMPHRKKIIFFVLFTMIFSGGLVPRYLLVKELGLIDSRLALILPLMLTAFNVIILKSFFQQIPESYEEAAKIDGAGDFTILFRIFIPLSKPVLATIALWTCVLHWNQWFDGLLYITSDDKQILQVFLQRIVVENSVNRMRFGVEDLDMTVFSSEALKAATVVITVLPLICAYPFMQRYFLKGITLGGVKE